MTRLRPEHRGPIPPHPRQRVRLPLPRAPSIDMCSPGSAFAEPGWVGARHRCLGFATEDPASDAPSQLRCSRPEWLDPASHSSALHRGGATGQTSPVDFCNQFSIREHDRRIVRTPRTALVVAHESSCFSNRSLSAAGRIAGGCARAHANQDVTGQGPARGRLPSMHGSSRRDRSRWELHPNPIGSDTSCREIVAPPAGDRRCQAITWMTSLRNRPACPASPRCSPSRVASREPPRRGMRSAEPEVPSIGGPPRERWVPSSPGCPQPVE
jgi:hypothetical protein